MTEQEIELLKRKRDIAKALPHITSNELGRTMQALVGDPNSGWTLYEGTRFRSEWSTRSDTPLTGEQFAHSKLPNGKWDHQNDLLSTFNGMIAVSLVENSKNELLVEVRVDDGESLTGHWLGVRLKAYLKGPWWTIEAFQDGIEKAFMRHAVMREQDEENVRRATRVGEIYDQLLAGTYVPVNTGEEET